MPSWGKSAALRWFSLRAQRSLVPPFMAVSRQRWHRDPALTATECRTQFGNALLAVRSDAAQEDRIDASQAGRFRSVLDVECDQLPQAITAVFASLPGDSGDGVIVQPMVAPVRYCAVASTHRVNDGAPWYCIDLAAGDSAAVTNGRASGRQIAIARESLRRGQVDRTLLSPAIAAVLDALLEVESLSGATPVEIEVVLTFTPLCDYAVHLLQVRPLVKSARWTCTAVPLPLPRLHGLSAPDRCDRIVGERAVLSLMSDWNPAELLGAHPRPLALSLFQFLIGHGVWWNARAGLGYQQPPHARVALLSIVAGRPYVDVRRSANSLLPNGLPRQTRTRIVEAWLDRLHDAPELHDKVEFAVYRTARDFTPTAALQAEWSSVLGADDGAAWERALGKMTAELMQPVAQETHRRSLQTLERADLSGKSWDRLLAACRRGTMGFAALARIAFIADAQLRSAMARGAITPARAQALRASSGSVGQLLEGLVRPGCAGGTSANHLRPGTFEITQDSWADRPSLRSSSRRQPTTPFVLSGSECGALNALLREAELAQTADEWVDFVCTSIKAREWAKFVFTRHLSAALESIRENACAIGLERECASWLTLAQLRRGASLPQAGRGRYWLDVAATAAERHASESRILLSPVLRRAADRHVADTLGLLPNFVGSAVVSGAMVVLDARSGPSLPLRGVVVVIRNADPGFDWLFDCGIAGLITAWGGANSHMAIRCAEFGLTAAIGCGEAVFARATAAQHALIDPMGGALWLD